MVRSELSGKPPELVALVAPTGAGKTATLLRLAERLELEVISADSVQVLRGFDIGSAKPTPAERARLPHHLVDLLPPTERYDAWRFATDAQRIWKARRARTPLVVTAGTGLYLRAWSEGLTPVADLEPAARAALFASVRADPRAAHARLAAIDPERAAAVHPHDWRRIGRALAIWEATGERPSAVLGRPAPWRGPRLRLFGIWAEGSAYEAALRRRVTAMLASGWIAEVEALVARHGWELPGLEAVGYRQVAAYLRGELRREELAERIYVATRRYAKRQRTWFRRLAGVHWFPYRGPEPDPGLVDELHRALEVAYNQ